MVLIPKGSFEMGPQPGEEEREGVPVERRLRAQHRVTIGYSFALGKYEVTRGEFADFAKATGYEPGISCWGWDTDGVLRAGPIVARCRICADRPRPGDLRELG